MVVAGNFLYRGMVGCDHLHSSQCMCLEKNGYGQIFSEGDTNSENSLEALQEVRSTCFTLVLRMCQCT